MDDEAIVIVTHHGQLKAERLIKVRQAIADYVNQLPGPVALITDFSDAQAGLSDIIALIVRDRKEGTPEFTVKRTMIFVGTNPLIRMYSQATRSLPFGDYGFIVCSDMDRALAFARDYLRDNAA